MSLRVWINGEEISEPFSLPLELIYCGPQATFGTPAPFVPYDIMFQPRWRLLTLVPLRPTRPRLPRRLARRAHNRKLKSRARQPRLSAV